MRGLPLTCGETPWSPDGTSHSTRQHSTQQQAQFAALHSLHSPAVSNARANLLLFSSDFLHQSDSSSLLQQLSNARAILLLFSSNFLRQSDSSSLLQRFPTPERFFFSSVFTLQKFLLSSLFLVVWMMPSPYSPSSFTLQSPDCSGIFLPDAFLSRFHGNHFSPRCPHKDFRSDIFSPSPLPAGTQVAGHFPKWSKSPFLNEKTSRGCVHNFGFGNLLGVLLTLRNDSSSS